MDREPDGKAAGLIKEFQMFSLRKTLAAASLLVAATHSGAFAANWPTTIAGTTWTGSANNTALTLTVKTQGGGSDNCATITGTMTASGGSSTATGYYCPASGQVAVFRSSGTDVFQVFSGSISQSPAPTFTQFALSGTFAQYYDSAITGFYPYSLLGPYTPATFSASANRAAVGR